MDDLTRRRHARADAETAWFMTEWDRLDPDERAAISHLVRWLHAEGLRHRPAPVAALDRCD